MAPYERVTKDEFVLWANYGGGWEEEITEDTKDEIKQRLKEYRENAGQYSYKWTKRRVRIEPKVEPEPEVEKAQFYRIVRYFANDRARNYTVRAKRRRRTATTLRPAARPAPSRTTSGAPVSTGRGSTVFRVSRSQRLVNMGVNTYGTPEL